MSAPAAAALSVEHVSVTFPGTRALDDVSLTVAPGEVHGLVGGNGSGKSTLIKVLAGVYQADAEGDSTLTAGGRTVAAARVTPEWSRAAGLRFVHQDPAVFPTLTVAENIAMGRGFPLGGLWHIRWRRLRRHTQELLDRFGIEVRPTDTIAELRPAERALVAIARALQDQTEASSGVLVLDEPTASLPARDVSALLDALRRFAAMGQSILFVSHRLPEVVETARRVTVFRDGRVVDTVSADGLTEDRLIELMVGRELERMIPAEALDHHQEGVVLDAADLVGGALNGLSLQLHHREVLGIAGVVGSGRTELLKSLFGAYPLARGTIRLDGKEVRFANVDDAMDAGMAYVPEDRSSEGAFADLTVRENLSAAQLLQYWSRGILHGRRESTDAEDLMSDYHVVARNENQTFGTLSGGNQQKVILARWLRRKPKILLLDEPTHGVDVGARAQIYALVRKAVEGGTSVIVVSSDYEELAVLCDRVLIMGRGQLGAELRPPAIDADRINEYVIRSTRRLGEDLEASWT